LKGEGRGGKKASDPYDWGDLPIDRIGVEKGEKRDKVFTFSLKKEKEESQQTMPAQN